jgi:hypothetical protein
MQFTSETAKRAQERKVGLGSLDTGGAGAFANLELAQQRRSLDAGQRREQKRQRKAAEQSPLVITLKCPCAQIHRAENFTELSTDELNIVHGAARGRLW